MPGISERKSFGGAERRSTRLGLQPLWDELIELLTNFQLLIKEEQNANGGAAVRKLVDERFACAGGWTKSQTGDVDWIKCRAVNGTSVCLGVEIQFSARSDLLVIDVVHIREQIETGEIDVGVIAVPSDRMSVFLTDRAPRYSDALKAIDRCRAGDLPIVVLALEHDGVGPALAKQRTRQGRGSD